MRKKFSIIFLAVVMSFSFIVNAFAASAIDPVTIDYGDGYTLKVSTVDISTFTVREKTRQMLIMAALILERFI